MSCNGCGNNNLDTEMLKRLQKDAEERAKLKKLCVICATVCVICTLAFGVILGVLASGIQIKRTTTETTTQSVDGDSAIINNADFEQYNDNATKNGGVD